MKHFEWMANFNLTAIHTLGLNTQTEYAGPFISLLLIYTIAALLNTRIPPANVQYPQQSIKPIDLILDFYKSNQRLWQDSVGKISLAVTTLFWGIGAVVQFAVLLWAKETLNMPLEKASLLQAIVAIGVIFGAAMAGRYIALQKAYQVLPLGIWLGISLPALAFSTSLWIAIPLMLITGFAGGMLMVPMNALLQNRGYHLLTAGRSIAVQGFNENASVMVMLGIYSTLLALEFPLKTVMCFMGATMVIGMIYLMRMAFQKTASTCSAI
jgi:hypothetical protein